MGFLTMFSWVSMWSVFGLISIITTIWFAGPLIAIAENKPLESVLARVIAIVVVSLIFLGVYLYKLYKSRAMNQHVIDEIKASDLSEETPKKGPEKESDLKEQFNNIDLLLQKQEGKENKNIFQKLFGSSNEYIYQKPWFVVIGAPGVGKTTAILNSGLSFPIGSTDHVSKLAGTRDCDWFLTDEALLLDTAGRFVEQNDDQNNTNDWNELLGLLKRCRPKQPINGLVLMLSAEDILSANDDKIKQQLQQIRLRLQEMQTSFNTTFPLYIIVNKLDLVSGFNQYFNYLDDQERKKVFGVPLDPLSETTAEKINIMTDEIDRIVGRIQQNIFKSVSYNNQVNDPSDLAIGFSNEFNKFSHSLKSYLKRLLNLSRYDTDINLAGVYFTSAEQVEDQSFILDENQNTLMQPKYLNNISTKLSEKARSYFINDIFQILLLDTANIAGIDVVWLKKQRKIYWVGVVALGIVFIILLSLLIRAFNYNSKYLTEISKQLALLEVNSKKVDPTEISSVLNFTNSIYLLPKNNISTDLLDRSFSKNLGLGQHSDIEMAAFSKQQGLIDENVLPLISNEIENKLRGSIQSKDYKDIYNDLKAYLMLYDNKKYDKKYIYQWLLNNVILKTSTSPESVKSLEKLLSETVITPQKSYDAELVTIARELLANTDIAEIIMQDLSTHTKGLDQKGFPVTSFVTMGGVSANNIFRRVSDKTLNDPVNILYTKFGYKNIFLPYVNKRLVGFYKEEKWVIGNEAQMKSVDEVVTDIYRIYSQAYTTAWKNYIQDVRMVQPKDLQQAIVMSKQFSEKNSSLAGIIKGISLNTNLIDPVAVKSPQENQTKPELNELEKKATAQVNPKVMIDETKVQGYLENISGNFSQYQNLTQSSQESESQLDEIIRSINDLYVYLVALELSMQSEDQLMPDVRPLVNYRAQVNRLPDPFRPMLDAFVGKVTESSQAYKDSQMSSLVKQQDQMLQASCKSLVMNKYPFSSNAVQDLSIQELGQLFGKDGTYLTALSSNVTVSQNSKIPYRYFLDNNVITRTQPYKDAETINMQLFAGKNVPKVDVVMIIRAMDKEIDNLTISYDGQKYQYYHGPLNEVVLTWPVKENRFTLDATAANERPERLEVNGDWSLFRLIDKASKVINTPDGRGVLATFELGDKKVYIEFRAVSGKNPFNLSTLRAFKC
ncbi:type VI secretion system membrane subunit TssM [Acinetobacter rudis]|uniref:type VI secretion system membrane subunit TssM n=1 Tax=Acinetobacter rudis TaxID=632955 RepID=UPI0033423BCA